MRILYIDIDSLRPDHLGCYGYARPTSPCIDAVAKQGVRFSNYYTSDSPCMPSRAACFSGRSGIQSGVVAHENTPLGSTLRYLPTHRGGSAPMWMSQLASAGLNTVSFSSFANRHLAGWFHFGFRQFNLTSLKNGNENADEVNELALPWFEKHAGEDDWFVHLNYWDPHTLYTEPMEYFEAMAAHPAPEWPDEATIQKQQSLTGIRTPQTPWTAGEAPDGVSLYPTMPDKIAGRADFEHLINGYDGAIAYADSQLQKVLDALEAQGVLDQTVIIISSDHGEAFGELGQYMEHGSASPAVNRVPLIVRWPGVTDGSAGTERGELLLNTDLCPTVCELLGLKAAPDWTGQSFAALLRGEDLVNPRSQVVWGHGLHTRQRALFDGRYLFIRTYEPGFYEYPPQMLFDLSSDPHQTNDLAPQMPELAQRMSADLLAWEREQIAISGQPDPMRLIQHQSPDLIGTIEAHLALLEGMGRGDDAQRLRAIRRRVPTDYAPQPL